MWCLENGKWFKEKVLVMLYNYCKSTQTSPHRNPSIPWCVCFCVMWVKTPVHHLRKEAFVGAVSCFLADRVLLPSQTPGVLSHSHPLFLDTYAGTHTSIFTFTLPFPVVLLASFMSISVIRSWIFHPASILSPVSSFFLQTMDMVFCFSHRMNLCPEPLPISSLSLATGN